MPAEIDLLETDKGARVPPQAVEIEEAVLGAMLMEAEAVDQGLYYLKPDDFYKPANKHIFEAIHTLHSDGKPVDLISIENDLRDRNLLDVVGGSGYLDDLIRSVRSSANIEYHAQIIAQKATKRSLIITCNELIRDAYDSSVDVEDVLLRAEAMVYRQLTGEAMTATQTMDTVVDQALHEIRSAQGTKDGITGIATGLATDELTAGLHKREVTVIAARPGMGKTALVLKVAKHVAHDGYKPGIISLEMGNTSLAKRMIYAEAGVDSQRGRRGLLSDEELHRVNKAGDTLRHLGIVMDDTTSLTPGKLRIKARMMKQVHKIDLLAIDYLQLMKSNDSRQNREQEVAEISRTCKLLAKELDIPVIELSQLSRKPEERRGWGMRPQNGDLRESGAIEQDADVVMMLFRPEESGLETYNNGDSTAGIIELIITKQREGPTGIKKMLFDKQTGNFKKLATYNPESPPQPHWQDEPEW